MLPMMIRIFPERVPEDLQVRIRMRAGTVPAPQLLMDN